MASSSMFSPPALRTFMGERTSRDSAIIRRSPSAASARSCGLRPVPSPWLFGESRGRGTALRRCRCRGGVVVVLMAISFAAGVEEICSSEPSRRMKSEPPAGRKGTRAGRTRSTAGKASTERVSTWAKPSPCRPDGGPLCVDKRRTEGQIRRSRKRRARRPALPTPATDTRLPERVSDLPPQRGALQEGQTCRRSLEPGARRAGAGLSAQG